jgi:hypothetical protein
MTIFWSWTDHVYNGGPINYYAADVSIAVAGSRIGSTTLFFLLIKKSLL